MNPMNQHIDYLSALDSNVMSIIADADRTQVVPMRLLSRSINVVIDRDVLKHVRIEQDNATTRRLMTKLESLTSLTTPHIGIVSAAVAAATRLRALNLFECFDMDDLGPLSTLSTLSVFAELRISNMQDVKNTTVTDLSPLSTLANLPCFAHLTLDFCECLTDLQPLSHLRNLSTLELTVCLSISDLQPLAHLVRLTRLVLNNCLEVTDLSPLQHCVQLVDLSLMHCMLVSDLRPLLACTHLETLNIEDTSVSMTNAVATMMPASLTDLNMASSDDKVEECAVLPVCMSTLVQLRTLCLNNRWNLSDITPLTACIRLERLDLSLPHDFGVGDVGEPIPLEPLARLMQLRDLDITGRGIVDVMPLAALTRLTIVSRRSVSDNDSTTDQ